MRSAIDAAPQQTQESQRQAQQTSPEDCRHLVARLRETKAGGIDPEIFKLRKAMTERACGGPVDIASDTDSCETERIRRQEVLANWDRKIREKEAALQEGVQDLLKLKQELQDEARWVGTGREIAAYILKPLDTAGNLFFNTLAIMPGSGELVRAEKAAKVGLSRILRRLEKRIDPRG